MGIFDSIALMQVGKVSQPWPNLANSVGERIAARWPQLVDVRGLWFTGSNVWRIIYGRLPDPFADWDMFELGGWAAAFRRSPIAEVQRRLGLKMAYYIPRKSSRPNGKRFLRPGLPQIDLWRAKSSVVDSLMAYPSGSHAHCRAAFSFTEGLVVLPNEAANAGGATPGLGSL